MTHSQIFILIVIGIIVTIFGVVFKFMEWPFASLLLIVGMTFEAAAAVTLAYKMMKKK